MSGEEEANASLIEALKSQLAGHRQQFVEVFQNPPPGIIIETIDVPWTPKDEQTQKFIVVVPDKNVPQVKRKYQISFVRAKQGPIAQSIIIENPEMDVTSSEGGHTKGWGETILPNGSLFGHEQSTLELYKLRTMTIRNGEILEFLGRKG